MEEGGDRDRVMSIRWEEWKKEETKTGCCSYGGKDGEWRRQKQGGLASGQQRSKKEQKRGVVFYFSKCMVLINIIFNFLFRSYCN